MGADLITTTVWSAPDAAFDWEAGRRAVAALDQAALLAELEAGAWCADAQDDEDAVAEYRAHLDTQVVALQGAFTGDNTRDLDWRDSPDGRWRCWIAGGTSWGDTPGDTFDALSALWWHPAVLDAIGFITATKMPAVS